MCWLRALFVGKEKQSDPLSPFASCAMAFIHLSVFLSKSEFIISEGFCFIGFKAPVYVLMLLQSPGNC